jgi:pectinesterase
MKLSLSTIFLLLLHTAYAQQDQTGKKYDFVVAKDGSGNFKTIQEAINAVPDMRRNETVIFIKNGIYKEKLVLAESKSLVHFIGESKDSTILTYDDFASKKNAFGEELGTSGSSSFYIYGKDFTAENITFENSSGPVGQAVAVLVAGDRAKFKNCRFLGFQDTLYTYGYESRQYYENCYIEGTVDFIFGASTAVFSNCTIFCKKGGYVTAASTPGNKKFGYVFFQCSITGDAPANSYYLGRPWRPFAKTAFIDCQLGAMIRPEGWHNWSKPDAERTTVYAEYNNNGPGASNSKRVAWSHQLTKDEAALYTLENILGDWKIK